MTSRENALILAVRRLRRTGLLAMAAIPSANAVRRTRCAAWSAGVIGFKHFPADDLEATTIGQSDS